MSAARETAEAIEIIDGAQCPECRWAVNRYDPHRCKIGDCRRSYIDTRSHRAALASRDAVIAKQAQHINGLTETNRLTSARQIELSALYEAAESRIADLEAKLAERTLERD